MRLTDDAIAQQLLAFKQAPAFVEARQNVAPLFPVTPLSAAPAPRSGWKALLAGVHLFVSRESDGLRGFTADQRQIRAQARRHAWEVNDLLFSPATQQAIDEGQKLLNEWQAQGWVDARVVLRAAGALESQGVAVMQPSGDSFDHEVLFNFRQSGQLPALGIRGNDRALRQRPSSDTLRQQLILAHEAAHTVFAQMAEPFEPARHQAALAQAEVAMVATVQKEVGHPARSSLSALNHHLFGKTAPRTFHVWLDESFADVYGTMMFLRTHQFHPQALDEVALMRDVRQSNAMYFHRQVQEDQRQAWAHPTDVCFYETAPCIDTVLARRHEWETLNPDDLRKVAQGIVSDAWIDRAATAGDQALIRQVVQQEDQRATDVHAHMVQAFVMGVAPERHAELIRGALSPEQEGWARLIEQSEEGSAPWVADMRQIATDWKSNAVKPASVALRQERANLEEKAFALFGALTESWKLGHVTAFSVAHQTRVAWMKAVVRDLLPVVAQVAAPPVPSPVQRSPSLGQAAQSRALVTPPGHVPPIERRPGRSRSPC
jgi:hypothetical protein